MNIEQAEQNCIKAARKWSMDTKAKQPDGNGNEARFWTEQFGYNVFDIVFGALAGDEWVTFLRQEPDIREKLVQVTLDTAMATWTEEQPVQRFSKEDVIEAALEHKPEPFMPSEPHKVVEPVKPVAQTAGTTAEKLVGMIPTDLEQLSKADVGRLLALAGHPPMVVMFKGGKKYVFRDKSSIVVDVSGARVEKA
jgi:hypothetical protein